MTIETHCQNSSPIANSSTLATLERARAVPLVVAIRCLPRKQKQATFEFPAVSLSTRVTLLALGGILEPDARALTSDQETTISLAFLCEMTGYSKATTLKHIEALAKAGWLATTAWTRTELTYSLSPAIWLCAELKRLTSVCKPEEPTEVAAQRKSLVHAIHLYLTQARNKSVPYPPKAEAFSPAVRQILQLVRFAVGEAQGGGDPTPTFTKILAVGRELTSFAIAPPPEPVRTESARVREAPRVDESVGIASPPAAPAPVPDLPAAARKPGGVSVRTAEERAAYLAKKKASDELFIVAVRLGKPELIQEIIRLSQDPQVGVADLETKLAGLRRLLREVKAEGRS